MATAKTDGTYSFLTGSTVEGQTYARHLANQNIQDIDILIHKGTIQSEESLISTSVPGFLQIKRTPDVEASGSTKFTWESNSSSISCLNGFHLKTEHCTTETSFGAPLAQVTMRGDTSRDASGASAEQTLNYRTIELDKQFQEALLNTAKQHDLLNFDTIKVNYVLFCRGVSNAISQYALPLFCTPHHKEMFDEQNINVQTFRDLFTLIGPAYDYDLPQVTRVRITALLDFYAKYKHVGNPKNIIDMADYYKSCAPVNADFVPALQLKFWPRDIQPFLNRIRINRPRIHQMIMTKTSMHVISKWSTKTPSCDRELEFRYSFSAVELLLAQQRSNNEQVLNGIARSIYFKHLKGKQNVIPSYFIKTTILWMCETMELNEDSPLTLGHKWLQYAGELLRRHECPHYFIANLNILEPYSHELLDRARKILQNDVKFDKQLEIDIFTASGQKQYRDKYNRNIAYFLSNLKASDLKNALREYRQFKHSWLSLSDSNHLIIDDDEVDIGETMSILNILRALDGQENENWQTFREIFLNRKASQPPIWGETVNKDNAFGFAESLMSMSIILTMMNDHITSSNFLAQGAVRNPQDFENYLNVIHSYLDPKNLSTSFQSTYAYFYDQQVSAFEHRRLIDNHPLGPPMTSTNNEQKGFYAMLMELCENAPNENMTLRELYQWKIQNNIDDDEMLAIAIQMSLDEANKKQ
ncbi:unnamed protein product [Didymodactylos carnosus]|uniref:Mab-21-like HhH/H2TH-like domain-containing protein n=1 Tax=Didymodactylos carnosus TaxID=1234261 RepID=A0A8S2KCV6_9BILA|nr:unnamed protein product [Didymodactylos carnosus]CAF3839440.1 unnamed protein product [Didymodactylos carnosus]